MSSSTPDTDLWLERSRLDGMILGAVSYGVFFLLTFQAAAAILRRHTRSWDGAAQRRWLLGYVLITFVLATIGFAGNVKYTEMIWIDLRNAPGGPAALIRNELSYWVNLMALSCYYVMEWFMQALLVHRCAVVWNKEKVVVVPMVSLFLVMVALSLYVLAQSSGAVFYNINSQLAYLCIEVGMTVLYTVLVVGRLIVARRELLQTVMDARRSSTQSARQPSGAANLALEQLRTYDAVATMVVESAAMYSVLGIIFIISFAVHSNITNLVFLAISHVQGIAQLFIIIRVVQGRAVQPRSVTSQSRPVEVTMVFAKGRTTDTTTMQPSQGSDTIAPSSSFSIKRPEKSQLSLREEV